MIKRQKMIPLDRRKLINSNIPETSIPQAITPYILHKNLESRGSEVSDSPIPHLPCVSPMIQEHELKKSQRIANIQKQAQIYRSKIEPNQITTNLCSLSFSIPCKILRPTTKNKKVIKIIPRYTDRFSNLSKNEPNNCFHEKMYF